MQPRENDKRPTAHKHTNIVRPMMMMMMMMPRPVERERGRERDRGKEYDSTADSISLL